MFASPPNSPLALPDIALHRCLLLWSPLESFAPPTMDTIFVAETSGRLGTGSFGGSHGFGGAWSGMVKVSCQEKASLFDATDWSMMLDDVPCSSQEQGVAPAFGRICLHSPTSDCLGPRTRTQLRHQALKFTQILNGNAFRMDVLHTRLAETKISPCQQHHVSGSADFLVANSALSLAKQMRAPSLGRNPVPTGQSPCSRFDD